MNVRRTLIGLVVVAGVFGWCGVAAATERWGRGNRINSVQNGGFLLGVWSLWFLLTAFIERPFFSAAGVKRNALRHSILTNLISSIVFGLIFFVLFLPQLDLGFDLVAGFFPILIVLLITAVAWLEYLLLEGEEFRRVTFAPIWLGNVASFATFVAIYLAALSPLGQLTEHYVGPYENQLACGGIVLAAAWVVGIAVVSLCRISKRATKSAAAESVEVDDAT